MKNLPKDLQGLAALFAASGVLHLARPQLFETIVPRQLPERRGLVYVSGVAELACAAAILDARTRRAAGWASAALLIAIFPANIQMAVTEGKRASLGTSSRGRQVAALVRLPLQIPFPSNSVYGTVFEGNALLPKMKLAPAWATVHSIGDGLFRLDPVYLEMRMQPSDMLVPGDPVELLARLITGSSFEARDPGVEFMDGGRTLGTADHVPFELTWTPSAGRHVLTDGLACPMAT